MWRKRTRRVLYTSFVSSLFQIERERKTRKAMTKKKRITENKRQAESLFFFTLPFFFFDFVRFPTVLFPICEVAASAAAAATTTATAALAAVGLFLAHSFSQLMPSPARPATRASPFDFV